MMRLTDVANQMEETRKENDSLITQVFKLKCCAIISAPPLLFGLSFNYMLRKPQHTVPNLTGLSVSAAGEGAAEQTDRPGQREE